jgi:hypothetical protein
VQQTKERKLKSIRHAAGVLGNWQLGELAYKAQQQNDNRAKNRVHKVESVDVP